jgi:hypothetical protein
VLHRSLTLTIAVLLAACGGKQQTSPGDKTPPGGANASGTLSGSVSFVGTPCPEPGPPPCDGAYPDYEVIVYAADGTTIAGKAKTGADGKFTLDLAPGAYVIFTQAGPMPDNKQRTEVTVSRDALATVTLSVDTGVR